MTAPADPYSYAYLLGAYLGDGYVADTGRSFQLVVTLDAAYPDIVEECRAAIVLSVPTSHPRVHRHPVHRAVRVTAGSKVWPRLLPQMGPGVSTSARLRSVRGSATSWSATRGPLCAG